MSSQPPTPTSSGETSLTTLLSTLTLTLHPPTYVFMTISTSDLNGTNPESRFPIPLAEMVLVFREPGEGVTVVVELKAVERYLGPMTTRSESDAIPEPDVVESENTSIAETQAQTHRRKRAHRYDYEYPCRMITCNVHSSLAAVGFMAVLATRLARCGISVNPVSGFFHDHLFVPLDKADEAVRVLEQVRQEASRGEICTA